MLLWISLRWKNEKCNRMSRKEKSSWVWRSKYPEITPCIIVALICMHGGMMLQEMLSLLKGQRLLMLSPPHPSPLPPIPQTLFPTLSHLPLAAIAIWTGATHIRTAFQAQDILKDPNSSCQKTATTLIQKEDTVA